MKQIKEKSNTYVQKEIEVDMWQTEDGKKFRSEAEAIKHEEYMAKRKAFNEKYKVKDIDTSDYGISCNSGWETSARMLYIEELNEETKKDLFEFYPYLNYSGYKLKEVKPGWNIFVESEYDSDSLSRWGGYNLDIYNVEDLLEKRMRQIENLKSIN